MSTEFDLTSGPVWRVVCTGIPLEEVTAVQAIQLLQQAFPRLTQAQLGRMIGGNDFVVARCKSKEEAANLAATLLRCGVSAKVEVPQAGVSPSAGAASPAPPLARTAPRAPISKPAPRPQSLDLDSIAAQAGPMLDLGASNRTGIELSAPKGDRGFNLGDLVTVSDTFDRPLPGGKLRIIVVACAVVLAISSIWLRTYIPGLIRNARTSAREMVGPREQTASTKVPEPEPDAVSSTPSTSDNQTGGMSGFLALAQRNAWDETVKAILLQRYDAAFLLGDREAAHTHNQEGLSAFRAKDLPKAIAAFREAVKADPGFPEGLNNLAYAYYQSGDLERAERLLLEVIGIAPDRASAWANLAELYAATNRVDQARSSLKITALVSTDRVKFRSLLTSSATTHPNVAFRAVAADVLREVDQVPDRKTTLLDYTPSDAVVAQVMDANYGAREPDTHCWRALDNDGNSYCMAVGGAQFVSEGTLNRLYVVAVGDNTTDQSHAASGSVGVFAYESAGDQFRPIAGVGVLQRGSYGTPPKPWRLARLGPSIYGWVAVDEGGGQGYWNSSFDFLVPMGDKVVELGLDAGESNAGACVDDDVECHKQTPLTDWNARFVVDPTAKDDSLFPLLVGTQGVKDGKELPAHTVVRVPFDAGAGKYVPPQRYPFN